MSAVAPTTPTPQLPLGSSIHTTGRLSPTIRSGVRVLWHAHSTLCRSNPIVTLSIPTDVPSSMGDDIVRIPCATDGCGTFPMDKALHRRLKKTGDTFTCPAGHQQHFTGQKDTEQRLRERISELEDRVARLQENLDSKRDTMKRWYERHQEEKKKRREVQNRLLDGEDGVVEVREETYMWACECGNTGRAEFETRTEARQGYEQHRENVHDEAEPAAA